MLIKGRNLLGKPIIHTDTPKPEIDPKAHDLLINEQTLKVSSLVFNERVPIDNRGISEIETDRANLIASSAYGLGITPLANTPYVDPEMHQAFFEQTYYIDIDKITGIYDDAIKMQNNEREGHDPEGTFSLTRINGVHVETISGKDLGKITDVIIDWDQKQLVGVELYEGFWASLLSDGVKYFPMNTQINIQHDRIIVADSKEEELVDEFRNLA